MRMMKQGMMLIVGAATVTMLASCSGSTRMAGPGSVPPASRVAENRADGAMAVSALASGRFAEAATLNAALLTHNPEDRQAQLGYALAQLGLGQTEQAVARLRALAAEGEAVHPDVGLALALAGQPREGRELLEQAAARPGADLRTRQNLALTLALADAWPQARMLVERDAGRVRATHQLTQWAVWAALPPRDRLASFLGVVSAASSIMLAHAEPPLLMVRQALPPEIQTAEAREPETPVIAATEAPESEAVVEQVPARTDRTEAAGATGWVVQLAAVRHADNLEAGWTSLQARYPNLLAEYTPQITHGQRWHRLSIGAFAGREDALTQCRVLRRAGIECFVRQPPTEGGRQPLRTQATATAALQPVEALHEGAQRQAPAV